MGRNIYSNPKMELSNNIIPNVTRPETPDYQDKLVKLIPGDIVAVYLSVCSLINSSSVNESIKNIYFWIIFFIVLIVTPIYLKKVSQPDSDNGQIVITSVAFIIWALTLGYGFDTLNLGIPAQLLGAIILPLFTLFIPILYKKNPSAKLNIEK